VIFMKIGLISSFDHLYSPNW